MQRIDEQRGEMPMAADRAAHGSSGGPDPVRIIADSPLLRSAARSSLDDLRPALEWVSLDESDVLFLGGDHGNALYFVAEGHLEITIVTEQAGSPGEKTQAVARIAAGDVVGEMQTLTGGRQLATVTALTSARLVKLAKESFDHYLATHPDVTSKLKGIFTPRFYRRQMLLVLSDMFGKMTPGMLVDIEKRMTARVGETDQGNIPRIGNFVRKQHSLNPCLHLAVGFGVDLRVARRAEEKKEFDHLLRQLVLLPLDDAALHQAGESTILRRTSAWHHCVPHPHRFRQSFSTAAKTSRCLPRNIP